MQSDRHTYIDRQSHLGLVKIKTETEETTDTGSTADNTQKELKTRHPDRHLDIIYRQTDRQN